MPSGAWDEDYSDSDLNGDGIPDVQPVDKNIDIDNDGDPDGNVDGGIDFTVSSKSKDENDEDVIDADKNVQVDGKGLGENLPKQLMGYR